MKECINCSLTDQEDDYIQELFWTCNKCLEDVCDNCVSISNNEDQIFCPNCDY